MQFSQYVQVKEPMHVMFWSEIRKEEHEDASFFLNHVIWWTNQLVDEGVHELVTAYKEHDGVEVASWHNVAQQPQSFLLQIIVLQREDLLNHLSNSFFVCHYLLSKVWVVVDKTR